MATLFGHWPVATGAWFIFMESLREASGGAIDPFGEPFIAAMAAYPARAHLGGGWFTPFADNNGRGSVRRALAWRMGERVGCPELKALAWLEGRAWKADGQTLPLRGGGNGGGSPITASAVASSNTVGAQAASCDANNASSIGRVRRVVRDIGI